MPEIRLQKDYNGSILLKGRELCSCREKDIARLVGFVPQNNSSSFGYTVFEYVLTGCASGVGLFSHPREKEKLAAWEALETMQLTGFADREITDLSGGERQQLAIARAIASKPQLILFDEPTAHLDYSNQIKVLRLIKKLSQDGYAVAVTTHDPNHAILLDGKVALFDGSGHVKSGAASELITEENLKGIYGSDLRIRCMEEFGRNVCLYPEI